MKTFVTGVMLAGLIAVAGCSKTQPQPASAGPNGGDLVSIKGGTAYAELVGNADTGEVMVHTVDKDMKTSRPIEKEPITVGSGGNSVELTPRPTDTDPSGTSSRFHGQADWMRGGSVRQGWMQGRGTGDKQEFECQRCWEAGRMHWKGNGPTRGHGTRGTGGPGTGARIRATWRGDGTLDLANYSLSGEANLDLSRSARRRAGISRASARSLRIQVRGCMDSGAASRLHHEPRN